MNFLPVWSAVMLLSGTSVLAAADEKDLPVALSLTEPDLPGAEIEPAAQERRWRFDFAVYLWMADLEGDVTIRGRYAEADADFGELFDHLKIAGTLHFEAWSRDKMGILADLNWMSFEDENDLGPGPIESTVTTTVGITEGAVAYRLKDKDERAFVDLLGGLRWILLDNEVEINGTPKETESHSYLDPIVGLRFGLEAAEWLLLTLRVDVGGFGIGTDIEGSSTALAAWRISPTFALVAGYRWFAVEVADDDSSVNLRMKGPLIAFDIGF